MSPSDKSKVIDVALRRLAGDVWDERELMLDDEAGLTYEAIMKVMSMASKSSKARLFDFIKSY